MPLIEDLERSGSWLFRWRSFLPVVIIPAALYVSYIDDNNPAFNDPRWLALCLGVGFLGQIIRAFTIAYVPKGTSGRNTSEGQVAHVWLHATPTLYWEFLYVARDSHAHGELDFYDSDLSYILGLLYPHCDDRRAFFEEQIR